MESPHWALGAPSQSHALAVRLGVLLGGQDAVSAHLRPLNKSCDASLRLVM